MAPAPPASTSFELGERLTGCNLESVDGQSWDGRDLPVRGGTSARFSGWLKDPVTRDGGKAWALAFRSGDKVYMGPALENRHARKDVPDQADGALLGFDVVSPVPAGLAGRVGVFLAEGDGPVRRVCGIGRGITVSP